VVIKVGIITVIKSLKNKKTFVLDTRGKSSSQANLNLNVNEDVHFVPGRKAVAGKEILLARSLQRGHLS
jgi:hypothetical protein